MRRLGRELLRAWAVFVLGVLFLCYVFFNMQFHPLGGDDYSRKYEQPPFRERWGELVSLVRDLVRGGP